MRFWYVVLLIGWLVSYCSNPKGDVGPPPAPPLWPTGQILYELLDLTTKVKSIDDRTAKAVVPSGILVHQDSVFDASEFVKKWNIRTSSDVRNFDDKASSVILYCTNLVLMSGAVSDIAHYELRSRCIKERGYNDNDMSYFNAKFRGA